MSPRSSSQLLTDFQGRGILRLRGRFASRIFRSAQDDTSKGVRLLRVQVNSARDRVTFFLNAAETRIRGSLAVHKTSRDSAAAAGARFCYRDLSVGVPLPRPVATGRDAQPGDGFSRKE